MSLSKGTQEYVSEKLSGLADELNLSEGEKRILDEAIASSDIAVEYWSLPFPGPDHFKLELMEASFNAFYDGVGDQDEWKEESWSNFYDSYEKYLIANTYRGMLNIAVENNHSTAFNELVPYCKLGEVVKEDEYEQMLMTMAIENCNVEMVERLYKEAGRYISESDSLLEAVSARSIPCINVFLPMVDESEWSKLEKIHSRMDGEIKRHIDAYYQRRSLDKAIPPTQAQSQSQVITHGRSNQAHVTTKRAVRL